MLLSCFAHVQETQNGQTVVPSAPLKRSSSWASSLTSTCSKGQDTSITGSVLPYTKSSSRHAVGPALNTNLKPRARQGSANDPQSIAARVSFLSQSSSYNTHIVVTEIWEGQLAHVGISLPVAAVSKGYDL
jgi:hypothetical protein